MKLLTAVQIYNGLAELTGNRMKPGLAVRIGNGLSELQSANETHKQELGKIKHETGYDQPQAVLDGLSKDVKLRPVDQSEFERRVVELNNTEVDGCTIRFTMAEIESIKPPLDKDGKEIPGSEVDAAIIARLAPIITE